MLMKPEDIEQNRQQLAALSEAEKRSFLKEAMMAAGQGHPVASVLVGISLAVSMTRAGVTPEFIEELLVEIFEERGGGFHIEAADVWYEPDPEKN